jgi:hypothetical protein
MRQIFKNIFRSRPKQSFTDFSFIGTDIHSHLIPGIDDGSKSMVDTLSLINGMQELGFWFRIGFVIYMSPLRGSGGGILRPNSLKIDLLYL